MPLHPGNVAKPVAGQADAHHPQHRAQDIEGAETCAIHLRYARHKGRKGANERHKACNHNGDTAIALVKSVGLIEGLAIEPA